MALYGRTTDRCIKPGLWQIEGWYAERIGRNPRRWRISKKREPQEGDYQKMADTLNEARQMILEELSIQ